MHQEYRVFLRILHSVCRYSADQFYDEPTSKNSQMTRPFHISHKEFCDHMYAERPVVEDFILRLLRTRSDLLCLVGQPGSGKTSIALKLRQKLAQSSSHRFFVCYLDVRKIIKGKENHLRSEEVFLEFLREKVKQEYIARLFRRRKQLADGRDSLLSLYAYLLGSTEDYEVFNDIVDLQDEAIDLVEDFRSSNSAYPEPETSEDRINLLYLWLEAEVSRDPDVKRLIRDLRARIELQHLIYAARFIRGYDRQVIWYDNVDALKQHLQRKIFKYTSIFHQQVSDYASSIIAIRDENVRGYVRERREDERDAPPYTTRIVTEPEINGNYINYPTTDVPVASDKVLHKIIRHRLDSTRRYQSVKIREILTEIDRIEREIFEAGDNKGLLVQLYSEKREKEEELEKDYRPAISSEKFSYLCKISAKLVDVFLAEKAIYLANNSIREFMKMHRDCLGMLFKHGEDDKGKPIALGYDNWYLATLFLRWLQRTDRDYRISFPNIMKGTKEWVLERSDAIGCSLPYLIVTTTWNLERERERPDFRYPEAKLVVDLLREVGFSRDTIHKQLLRHLQNRVIQYRNKDIDTDAPVKLDEQIFSTLRGKCLAGVTCNSFGYIYECVRDLYSESTAVPERDHLLDHMETPGAVQFIVEDLCYLGEMHLNALVEMRDGTSLGGERWLRIYRDRYGLPNQEPFRRNVAGVEVSGQRKALLFESLTAGLLAYTRDFNRPRSVLNKLRTSFNQTIARIESFEIDEGDERLNLTKIMKKEISRGENF